VLRRSRSRRRTPQRPTPEIDALIITAEHIAREADELHERGVRVRALGALDRLTPDAAAAVQKVVDRTAANDRLIFNLFISYSGRAELARAARLLAEDAAAGRIVPSAIDESTFASRLYTHGCPDPDLLIRTSGEQRISNFLLWQMAYSELFLSRVLWPDFTRGDLYEAIRDYQLRERRFGRVPA
jgi:undecaprenyl diphosphate synthase